MMTGDVRMNWRRIDLERLHDEIVSLGMGDRDERALEKLARDTRAMFGEVDIFSVRCRCGCGTVHEAMMAVPKDEEDAWGACDIRNVFIKNDEVWPQICRKCREQEILKSIPEVAG